MTKRFFAAWFTTFATLSVPTFVWGHPGHGVVDSGPAHYVLEPVHAFSIACAIALGIAVTVPMLATKIQRYINGV